jgi:hypothetical protein
MHFKTNNLAMIATAALDGAWQGMIVLIGMGALFAGTLLFASRIVCRPGRYKEGTQTAGCRLHPPTAAARSGWCRRTRRVQ